jgi:hypothetical protein
MLWHLAVALIKSTQPAKCGAIAQLGERIVRNDEVVGSSPTSSTNSFNHLTRSLGAFSVPNRSNSVDSCALQLLHLSLSRFHHRHRALNRPALAVGNVLRVDVHGGGDARVSHLPLRDWHASSA